MSIESFSLKILLSLSQNCTTKKTTKRSAERCSMLSDSPAIKDGYCPSYKHPFLVGGLEHVLFSHILGIMTPTD